MLKKSLLFVLSINLFANEFDSSLLSTLKQKEIILQKEQNRENSSKLKDSWISNITLSHSKSFSDMSGSTIDTNKTILSMNQPVFKSGGIYYAIKYADAIKELGNINVTISQRQIVKSILTTLYEIEKVDLSIAKQELLIANSKIDIQRKKEKFDNGFLDSGELDNAILNKNGMENNLFSLLASKQSLISNLNNLSDIDYKKQKLPVFSLVDRKSFLDNNLTLKQIGKDVVQKDLYTKIIKAKFMPTISLNASYTKTYAENSSSQMNDDYLNYGITFSMPFDINYSKEIQLAKIDSLKTKLSMAQTKKELDNFYKNSLHKININNKKRDLVIDDYKLYLSLVIEATEQRKAGLKTQMDIDTLENSKRIKEIEKRVLEIENQLILIELLAKVS
jgi:outer membrane protein TolC